MRPALVSALFASAGLLAGLLGNGPAAEPADTRSALEKHPKGWEDLLPGKGLRGWRRVPIPPDPKLGSKNPWGVDAENRVLVCDGAGVKEMLLDEKERGDGIFHVEWRFKKTEAQLGYNSGVYVRTALDGKNWYQVQVAYLKDPPRLGDIFFDEPAGGGAKRVVIRGEGSSRARPPGEWNTYEVTCKGKTISVWINGAITAAWNECPVPRGHVGLQAELWYLEFRNLRWKELGKGE
jgi:hypothetical protein